MPFGMPTTGGAVSADALGSCECCQERFGRLEALRAPIPLGCRHVICIGCLRDDGSSCPICGVAYSKGQFRTLFDLVATSPHYTPLPLEAEDIARVLRNRCLALNETTPLSMLRDVFNACNHFLKDQPRNKFTELENSARFLGYQIKAEETIQAMAFSMESLAGTVQHLNQRLDEEKEGRANDRALFDQQLNEASVRELNLLARMGRLEIDLTEATSDRAAAAELQPVPIPSATTPRIESSPVHVPRMYSRSDDISGTLSPLPIGSISQGFGAIGALRMPTASEDEPSSGGRLYSLNGIFTELPTSNTTGNIAHFPYSTTALFPRPTPDYSGQFLGPMISTVPRVLLFRGQDPPAFLPRQTWLPLELSGPLHVSSSEEDNDEYFDFVEDSPVPEFQP